MQKQMVTKEMTVADIISLHPQAADIMQSYGLSCFGCSVNTMESIEMGARGHGIPDQRIEEMVSEINDSISTGKTETKEEAHSEPVTPLDVTASASSKMKEILSQQGKPDWGIRVSAMPGGCAGYMYGMDFAKEASPNDKALEFNGVNVFVDSNSYGLLSGVRIDYIESLSESGFKFENPGAKASCGCGKSFH